MPGLAQRATHAVSQLLFTLGVGGAPPPPPLLWLHGDHPQLAATLALGALRRRLYSAAAAHFQRIPRSGLLAS